MARKERLVVSYARFVLVVVVWYWEMGVLVKKKTLGSHHWECSSPCARPQAQTEEEEQT